MLPIIRRMRREPCFSNNLFRIWKQILNLTQPPPLAVSKRVDRHFSGGIRSMNFCVLLGPAVLLTGTQHTWQTMENLTLPPRHHRR